MKSIRAKPQKDSGYGGTPGAPAFRLGRQQQQDKEDENIIEVGSDDDNDGSSSGASGGDLSELSREELIKRLRRAHVSKPTGSAPNNRSGSHSKAASQEQSLSSSDSSSGSSSSSNESDKVMNGTDSG